MYLKTFADKVLAFYQNLSITEKLPKGVEVLNPYQDKQTFEFCRQFYKTFYDDTNERFVILGINPGRFGGGLTGIPFTDPVKLEKICDIKNDLPKKAELSADFIHLMIESYGGLKKFYSKFFFNSVSPLGFTMNNKNLNYYDTPALIKSLEKYIVRSLNEVLELGINREKVFCLGEGENFKYLAKLNEKEKLFKEIIPLSHPRFIMQYRRKHLTKYVDDYLQKLSGV
jgi:hypothetical protein